MKKLLSIIISFSLIFSPYSYAGVISEVCTLSGETNYLPIGDERGHSVLTKKEVNRDCNLTIESQGACIQWEEKVTDISLDVDNYDTYRSSNYEDSIGSIFAIMGAYDQLEHLWSGWKGYCEKGMKTDFSWVSDPFFWGSLMASTIMQGASQGADGYSSLSTGEITVGGVVPEGGGEAIKGIGKGFLADTSVGQSYNSFISSVNTGFGSIAGSLGAYVGQNFGQCLVASGIDMMSSVYSSFVTGDSDKDCDPVDEFCEATSTNSQEGDVMTIDKSQYEDLIAEHPEAADYIIILSEENGILTIRFKNVSELDNYNALDQAQLEEMKNKMKNMLFLINAAITIGKLAACGLTGGKLGSTSSISMSDSDASRFSVKDGMGFALNALPAEWLGPYGALFKAALAIAMEFIFSFNKINTCTDADDAQEAGTRHKKTQESLPYNLCKQTAVKCVEKKFLGSGCGLYGYDYCCYDQILTKILVEQFKAQLGRDWKHCTGITLRDLNYVSFRQCTALDKTFGVDGAKVILNYNTEGKLTNPYNPQDSYQYKRKCIDLTEYKEHLSAVVNSDIDFSDFDSIFNDLSNQI